MSNYKGFYKGFPLCQANEVRRAAQRLESTALLRIALIDRARCGLDKLQPVIDAALLVAECGRRP